MKRQLGLLYRADSLAVETVRPADGRKFELAELQKLVGGYIEVVPGSTRPFAYCNEEGRLKGLPVNELASIRFHQLLVGDVIEVKTEAA